MELPEDLGSSLAVGLDRRWGQCRFGEVLGSMGRQRLISHQKVHQGAKRQRKWTKRRKKENDPVGKRGCGHLVGWKDVLGRSGSSLGARTRLVRTVKSRGARRVRA